MESGVLVSSSLWVSPLGPELGQLLGRNRRVLLSMALRNSGFLWSFHCHCFLFLPRVISLLSSSGKYRGKHRVQKKTTFCSLLIFLKLCWKSLEAHLYGGLHSYQEFWNSHHQGAVCLISFLFCFQKNKALELFFLEMWIRINNV